MNNDDILDYDVFKFSENQKYKTEIAKISRLMIRNAMIFAGAMWLVRTVVFGSLSYSFFSAIAGEVRLDYFHIQTIISRIIEVLIIGYLFRRHFFNTKFQTKLYLVASLGMMVLSIGFYEVISGIVPNMVSSFLFSYAYYVIAVWVVKRSYSFLAFKNYELWIVPLLAALGFSICYQILISFEMYEIFSILNVISSGVVVFIMMFALKQGAIRTFQVEEF